MNIEICVDNMIQLKHLFSKQNLEIIIENIFVRLAKGNLATFRMDQSKQNLCNVIKLFCM